MKYNIAIKLPKKMLDKSIEISKIVAGSGGIFELDVQNNFPHISIAHFECNNKNDIEKIIDDVNKAVSKMQVFNIKSDKYRVSNGGWVDISFYVQKETIFLYDMMINIFSKYDCKVTSDDWRQQNAPHITFSRIAEDIKFDTCILPKYDFSFIVDKIELFERGAHGVCEKELNIFKLNI